MESLERDRTYMSYWHFSLEEKDKLIERLTIALPALRAAAKAIQEQVANAIGISRQTYCAVEMQKRKMSWNILCHSSYSLTILLTHTMRYGNLTYFRSSWMIVDIRVRKILPGFDTPKILCETYILWIEFSL